MSFTGSDKSKSGNNLNSENESLSSKSSNFILKSDSNRGRSDRESMSNVNMNEFKTEDMQKILGNNDVYDNNYGLGTLDSFIKLKTTAKNIPVHRLLANLEREAEYTNLLLKQGKKQRQIINSKLITSDNQATDCAQKLLQKVITDLDLYRKDMRKIIKKNMDNTTLISKEVYEMNGELKRLNKEFECVDSLLKEAEDNLGIIDYWTGYGN